MSSDTCNLGRMPCQQGARITFYMVLLGLFFFVIMLEGEALGEAGGKRIIFGGSAP